MVVHSEVMTMKMIVRYSKTTGNVKSIIDYEPAMYRDLEKIYNNNNLSTSTVDVVDIPESAFDTDKDGIRTIRAGYIKDVLERNDVI